MSNHTHYPNPRGHADFQAAYWDGFKAGSADKRLGRTSGLVMAQGDDINPYVSEYARGYRMGQRVALGEVEVGK